ncbi:MAG: hypothetical protein AAB462_01615 [Patescibacteria group bacterium]
MSEAIAANFGPMNYQHEAEPVVDAIDLASTAVQAPSQHGNLKRNLMTATAVIGSVLTAASFAPSSAEAADTGTPVVSPAEVTGTVAVAKSSTSVESLASGKVVILGNMMVNGLPKKQIRKLEKEGKCKIVDGSEEDVWTQGRQEKGKPYGKDTRTSEFCKVNGKWVRVACGNDAKFTPPKNVVKAPIIWVKNYAKAKMTLNAKATAKAEAYCKTPFTYAYAYGFGESSASVSASVKASMKAKGKGFRKVTANIYGKVSGEASAKASASAVAECHDQGGVVVPPKDGTQGPGTGTPGQAGGPGAGGEAGNPTNGAVCRDTTDPTTGDHNSATEGDIVTGDPDQFGNC